MALEFEDVRLMPAPGVFTKAQADSFFARQEQWRIDVQSRREQLHRDKADREFHAHPYAPHVTEVSKRLASMVTFADADGRSPARGSRRQNSGSPSATRASTSAPDPDPAGTRTPQSDAAARVRITPYKPAACRLLPEGPLNLNASTDLLQRYDAAVMGSMTLAAARAAPKTVREAFDRVDVSRCGLLTVEAVIAGLRFIVPPGQLATLSTAELPSRVTWVDFVGLHARFAM